MADLISTLHHHCTVFDAWRFISISLYMTLAGYGVLVGITVISTAWVNLLGFSEVEVGRVAGADLGGLSFGAVVAALLVAMVFIATYLVSLAFIRWVPPHPVDRGLDVEVDVREESGGHYVEHRRVPHLCALVGERERRGRKGLQTRGINLAMGRNDPG